MKSAKVWLGALFSISVFGGCATYYQTGAPPPSVFSDQPPDTLALRLRDGRSVTLTHVHAARDTIWGIEANGTQSAVPVRDVASGVAVGRRQTAMGILIVTAGVVALVLVGAMYWGIAHVD